MTESQINRARKIAEQHTSYDRLVKLSEELSEALNACIECIELRGCDADMDAKASDAYQHLNEEIADAEILLEEYQAVYNPWRGSTTVYEWIEYKLGREEDRMK